MHNRLYSYFEKNKLLYGKPFGLRAHHSIDLALVELVDIVFDSFNERKHTVGIFVNLPKAFETTIF